MPIVSVEQHRAHAAAERAFDVVVDRIANVHRLVRLDCCAPQRLVKDLPMRLLMAEAR
jgi:hypothetical protein